MCIVAPLADMRRRGWRVLGERLEDEGCLLAASVAVSLPAWGSETGVVPLFLLPECNIAPEAEDAELRFRGLGTEVSCPGPSVESGLAL